MILATYSRSSRGSWYAAQTTAIPAGRLRRHSKNAWSAVFGTLSSGMECCSSLITSPVPETTILYVTRVYNIEPSTNRPCRPVECASKTVTSCTFLSSAPVVLIAHMRNPGNRSMTESRTAWGAAVAKESSGPACPKPVTGIALIGNRISPLTRSRSGLNPWRRTIFKCLPHVRWKLLFGEAPEPLKTKPITRCVDSASFRLWQNVRYRQSRSVDP